MLLAGLPYDDSTESEDEKYIYRHLTNTARAAEIDNFDEKKFVKVNQLQACLLYSHMALDTSHADYERHFENYAR